MSMRLGIIGTGRIANRFATDAWQELDVRLSAVYNPNLKSAEAFCCTHHLPMGTDNWTAFLEEIDAAYIASPSFTHADYIRKLLENQKHVLCEKPMLLRKRQRQYWNCFMLIKRKS